MICLFVLEGFWNILLTLGVFAVRDQKIQSAAIAMQVLLPELSEEKITTCLRENHGDADRAWHQLQDINDDADRIDPIDATGATTHVSPSCSFVLLLHLDSYQKLLNNLLSSHCDDLNNHNKYET